MYVYISIWCRPHISTSFDDTGMRRLELDHRLVIFAMDEVTKKSLAELELGDAKVITHPGLLSAAELAAKRTATIIQGNKFNKYYKSNKYIRSNKSKHRMHFGSNMLFGPRTPRGMCKCLQSCATGGY